MRHDKKLIVQFSFIGLAVTLVVAAALSYLLQRILVNDALDVTTTIASEHVTSGLDRALSPDDMTGPLTSPTLRKIDAIAHSDLARRGIVRVRIWSRNRKLLYSNNHLNIGKSAGEDEELDEALAGQIGRELSNLKKAENPAGHRWGHLLEVYVPLRLGGSDRVLGAYEIYQTTEALDRRLSHIRLVVVFGVFAGFGVLFLGLFGVVLSAAQRLYLDSLENERLARDMADAYDQTIAGWAKALDLKDQETEGHSRRVTEMAVAIAVKMGVPEDDLVDIRRGALLHDIGKMGIPDEILKKPGPLTAVERAIMEQHTNNARHVLGEVGYLAAAMDIPLYHHEKWDGSGYPNGLSGDDIPLAARIFAVVDVWDALINDQYYRPAWPAAKARAHISQQAGRHFDPAVVEAFLPLVSGPGTGGKGDDALSTAHEKASACP